MAVFWLAWSDGANDNFRGVATLYGSKTVGYRGALLWATAATILGSVFSVFLAERLATQFSGAGIVPIEKIDTILGDVKDETFGYDEPAFYTLVSVVSKLPAELLKPDEETVPYSQLLSTPSSFRGKPVTLRGVYMTVAPWRVPVVAIAKDIPRLFTCTIREKPMEQKRPVATVVVLEDPMPDFKAFDEVRIKGYFYKVRKYEGSKGVGYAPMLVAQRLEPDVSGPRPFEGPAPGSSMFSLGLYAPLAAFMGGALIVLFIVFFYVKRMGRSATDANRKRLPHRIRLQRPDQPGPLEDRGPGGEGGGQGPQGGPGH